MSSEYEKSANYAPGQTGLTIVGELDAYDRLWDSAYAWLECCGQIRAEAAARRIAQTNEECASQVTQDRLPMIDEELHAADQVPAGAHRLTRNEILARAAQIEKDRRSTHQSQGNSYMRQTNESSSYAAQQARLATKASGSTVAYVGEAQKAAPQSQIEGLLLEQDCLLSKLSDEIYTAEGRFSAVLIPQPPTSDEAASDDEPMPAMSALGWSIHDRNNRIRAMLALLRSINERSTVAP